MRVLPLAVMLGLAATFVAADEPSRARVTGSVSGKVSVLESGRVAENSEVVLYIVGPPNDEDAAPETAEIIQTDDLRFIPDLVVITVGDSVAFPNRGTKVHNVYSPRPRFYLDFKAGESKAHRFTEKGVVEVYCNLHPTKAATVIVAPNRHHTGTNNGAFRLENVPVGDWELFAYTRRAMKPTRTRISVTPDGVDLDLTLTRGVAPPGAR